MIKGREVRIIIILFILLVVCFGLYQLYWYGTISISHTTGYERVDINSKPYTIRELKDVKVRPGSVEITAYGKFKNTHHESINVNAFSDLTIELPERVLTKNEVLDNLGLELEDGYQIIDYSFLVNDYWLVIGIGPKGNSQLEGGLSIYRFNTMTWETVESGTGLGVAHMHKIGLPDEVITYIGGLGD